MLDEIRDYIVNELRWSGSPADLTEDYPLIENDVIDSMGLFLLVGFLESQGVEVADEDLIPENFATLGAIGRMLAEKRAPAG